MKRRVLSTVVIGFCLLLLTSCFDGLESISYENDEYKITYRLTISKLLLEMASSTSGESINYDSITEEISEQVLENASIEPVNTDLDFGVSATMRIKKDTKDEEQRKILPSVVDGKCFIPLLLKDERFDDLGKDISSETDTTFLANAKWRILISKKIIADAKSAYIENTDTEERSYFSVTDLTDMYYIEIPFLFLMSEEASDYVVLSNEEE